MFDATFVALASSQDTAHTTITIDSIAFMPRVADGTGCATQVTINPLCGLHGVGYSGTTSLSQNYPNPFTGATTFTVTLDPLLRDHASMKVYDLYGRCVSDLSSQITNIKGSAGSVQLASVTLASGMYACVLEAGGERIARRVHVVR